MIRPEACPGPVREALARLRDAGYAAQAVGGCVRDCLLGREPHDWDITTSAFPQEVREVFAGVPVIPTGEKHGTVTVLLGGSPLEITTYRVDGPYSDSRRPDSVAFTRSLREDLARRDFTVNAMAWSPEEGITDCFGGREDLAAGIIRCVGDPDRRFGEDALRILRGLRFAAALDFSLDQATAQSLRRNRERLRLVAPQRVFPELLKLLCGPGAGRVLREFPEVFAVIIPELEPLRGFDQRTPYHLWDVYEHTVRAVEGVPPEPVLRLTMLLHDIGKPACFFTDRSGRGHFKGHPAASEGIAREVLRRLDADGETARRVRTLVRWHDAAVPPERPVLCRWLRELGPGDFFTLLQVKRADDRAKNPAFDRGSLLDKLEALARDILEAGDCLSLEQLAVSGKDLLAAGVAPGREIGASLEELLEGVLAGNCPNEKAALLRWLPEHRPMLSPEYPRKPEFRVRQARREDVPAVADLWERICRRAERALVNPSGWRSGIYPGREEAEDAVSAGTLWLLEDGGLPAGAVILNHDQAGFWVGGSWEIPAEGEQVLAVHTLSVDPGCSRRGGGRFLLDFARKLGRETGCKALRLDVFTENSPAIALYETYGFRRAGTLESGLPGLKWFRLYELPV